MLYLVFYADWPVSAGMAAKAVGPIIFIRPSKKGNVGLLEHEKVHVRQFWRTLGLFGIPYYFSAKARIRYEVEAYREQLKYAPGKEAAFANSLATKYNAKITPAEALAMLVAP